MQWGNILLTELAFTGFLLLMFGFVRLPRFLRRKVLARGFPWGYYTDQAPRTEPSYFDEFDEDFLHDTGTSFGGMEGFGDFGEFSGFGEMGEFGANFGAGGDIGGA